MKSVDAGEVQLTIDYGTVTTKAILAWPDGRWTTLLVDGSPLLSSAVYADPDGTLYTGTQAWQHAPTQPQCLEPEPRRRIREGTIQLGTRAVEALDLIAATLRRVGAEATRVAGQPVGQVRLVVPAGWGPRRRTAIRTATHRAGLPAPTLVEAPVAVAQRLIATGTDIPVGAAILICDYGADFEATLLRRTAQGFDILATMAAPDASGDHIDRDLAEQLAAWTGQQPNPGVPDAPSAAGQHLMLRVAARTAKQSLSTNPAVTVPVPPHPPIVLTAAQLDTIAIPVLTRAAHTAREALDAVEEVTAGQLAGAYSVGGTAQIPTAARLLGEEAGLPAVTVADPQFAAVRGAAHAIGTGIDASNAPAPPEPAPPPLRRAFAVLVPGLGSIALLAHAYGSAHLERQAGLYDPNAYVLANWGELAMASVFALITCLAAATLIASAIPPPDPGQSPHPAPPAGAQIGTALLVAVAIAISLSLAGLYAIAGSVYFALPNGPFLRWALLPQIPIAAAVIITAGLSTRLRRVPPGGWHAWLTFPTSSLICAAVGTVMIQVSMSAPRYPSDETVINVAGRAGALLLGVGAGLVATRPLYRLIIAAPLAVFAAAIVSWPATGMLAIIYTVAVTMWWVQSIYKLIRSPAGYRPYLSTDIEAPSPVRTVSVPRPPIT